jgi:predicted nucleic acid-binding protein
MIVVDSSALIAILEKEPDAAVLRRCQSASRAGSDFSGQCSRIWNGVAGSPWHARRRSHVALSQRRK